MTKEITLTQGQVALIDDWNLERVSQYKWWAQKDRRTGMFYAVTKLGRQTVFLHNIIMNPPPDMEVDHIDHDRLNCHEDNMRVVSHANNMKNRILDRDNKSGFKGVSIFQKWYKAEIRSDGKHYYLGIFNTAEEAAHVYDDKARELHGEFATLNFPLPGEQGVKR